MIPKANMMCSATNVRAYVAKVFPPVLSPTTVVTVVAVVVFVDVLDVVDDV